MSGPENPSAFPRTHGEHGMTLRDWFAGQALPAVIRQCAGDAAFGYPDGIETMEQMFAVKSYALAEAMLAERAKGGEA